MSGRGSAPGRVGGAAGGLWPALALRCREQWRRCTVPLQYRSPTRLAGLHGQRVPEEAVLIRLGGGLLMRGRKAWGARRQVGAGEGGGHTTAARPLHSPPLGVTFRGRAGQAACALPATPGIQPATAGDPTSAATSEAKSRMGATASAALSAPPGGWLGVGGARPPLWALASSSPRPTTEPCWPLLLDAAALAVRVSGSDCTEAAATSSLPAAACSSALSWARRPGKKGEFPAAELTRKAGSPPRQPAKAACLGSACHGSGLRG